MWANQHAPRARRRGRADAQPQPEPRTPVAGRRTPRARGSSHDGAAARRACACACASRSRARGTSPGRVPRGGNIRSRRRSDRGFYATDRNTRHGVHVWEFDSIFQNRSRLAPEQGVLQILSKARIYSMRELRSHDRITIKTFTVSVCAHTQMPLTLIAIT